MNLFWKATCVIIILFFTGCVSKKKVLEQAHQTELDHQEEMATYKAMLDTANATITDLSYDLVEKNGAYDAAFALNQVLRDQIEALEEDIDNMSSSASSQQSNLARKIRNREAKITEKNELIEDIYGIIEQEEKNITRLLEKVNNTLTNDPNVVFTELSNGVGRITLQDQFLFGNSTYTKINDEAYDFFEGLTEIVEEYPTLNLEVIGHTDNQKPASKSFKDNWSASVAKAVAITRLMVEEFFLGSNRIKPAGKAATQPLASNESDNGRQKNQRVEILVSPKITDLIRNMRSKIK